MGTRLTARQVLLGYATAMTLLAAAHYAHPGSRTWTADAMIAGGAEELHFSHAGVFDLMYATSTTFNGTPDLSPRPFDQRRDGLVVGVDVVGYWMRPW